MATPSPTHPVAIITGAASGIGLALTKHLMSKSYKVFMADVNPHGEEIATELVLEHTPGAASSAPPGATEPPAIAAQAEAPPPPTFVHTDISSFTSQLRLFQAAYSYNGSIDFFAANAGIDDSEDIFAAEVEDFSPDLAHATHPPHTNGAEHGANGNGTATSNGTGDEQQQQLVVRPPNLRTLDVDLAAVISGVKLFVAFAKKSNRDLEEMGVNEPKVRRMVITSSMVGIYPFGTQPLYCAAKHALIGLTRSLAPRLSTESNILLNALLPAFVPTGLAPPGLIGAIEKCGHITPMSSILAAYDAFLGEGPGDCTIREEAGREGEERRVGAGIEQLAGATVEVTLQELHFRNPPAYANESQRWLCEDAASVWGRMYDEKGQQGKGKG